MASIIPNVVVGMGLCLACATFAAEAENSTDITAVAARASDDYVRSRLPDGTFSIEYYAFGDGGHYGGQMADESVDKLKFTDVARMIANPLAAHNYVPARDAGNTRLLIMVYWGLTFVPEAISASPGYTNFSYTENAALQTASLAKIAAANRPSTVPSGYHSTGSGSSAAQMGLSDSQLAELSSQVTVLTMFNEQRDRTDFRAAKLLGYDYDAALGTENGNYIRGTAFGVKRDDLVSELESNRYFVVLMAYDFQMLLKQKRHKLLWETRFSVRQNNHAFDRDLPMMAGFASQYFGQNTNGLVRQRMPFGNVTIGEVKSLGTVEPASK